MSEQDFTLAQAENSDICKAASVEGSTEEGETLISRENQSKNTETNISQSDTVVDASKSPENSFSEQSPASDKESLGNLLTSDEVEKLSSSVSADVTKCNDTSSVPNKSSINDTIKEQSSCDVEMAPVTDIGVGDKNGCEHSQKASVSPSETKCLSNTDGSELPSIGIMVIDGPNNTSRDSHEHSNDPKIKSKNDSIRKVSARLSMESFETKDLNNENNFNPETIKESIDTEQLTNAATASREYITTTSILSDTEVPNKEEVEIKVKAESIASSTTCELAKKSENNDPSNSQSEGATALESQKICETIDTASLENQNECEKIGATAVSATPSTQSSPSETIHKVKRIKFCGKDVPVITQNNNGPCPLLAILNALLLKGEVDLGVAGNEVKGGHLVSVVANALIDHPPPGSASPQLLHNIHRNTDDAVQILDKLLTGLDVNVRFSGVQDFEFTNELCVFDGLRVNLYHGWVVDPECPAAEVVQQLSYNQLTTNMLTWWHEAGNTQDDILYMKAALCEEFLQLTSSQLTVHGLFALASTMVDSEVAVLFRNNHFSTIYKHKDQLYQLLTDQGFLTEAVVWQTLSDVDSSFSEFVTAMFEPWQLQQVEPLTHTMTMQQQITTDEELAAVLQQESDQRCQNEETFTETLNKLGCDSAMTDEEIARRLQDEEVRAAEAATAAEASRVAPATAVPAGNRTNTSSSSSNSPSSQQSSLPTSSASPDRQNRKKKDQCCIL
uniref:Ubiquitin carboxyl-terminal hydrolase n=2 Tax=Hirondellea gigas TaxID=1518452 RepID=A0A2P2I8Z7_9CRUS